MDQSLSIALGQIMDRGWPFLLGHLLAIYNRHLDEFEGARALDPRVTIARYCGGDLVTRAVLRAIKDNSASDVAREHAMIVRERYVERHSKRIHLACCGKNGAARAIMIADYATSKRISGAVRVLYSDGDSCTANVAVVFSGGDIERFDYPIRFSDVSTKGTFRRFATERFMKINFTG